MTKLSRRGLVAVAVSFLTLWNRAKPLMGEEAPEVTAVVTGQKYCLGPPTGLSLERVPPDAVTLMFQVQLAYRNTSFEPIIVPKVANPTIILSPSLNDASRRMNQIIIRPKLKRQLGDLETHGIDVSFPKRPYFEVLQPGPQVQQRVTEDLSFRVHDPSDTQAKTEFLGKKVFVQVELDHLLIPKELAKKLAKKWSSIGTLWTGTVRTQPMEFSIPSSPETSVCPSQIRID